MRWKGKLCLFFVLIVCSLWIATQAFALLAHYNPVLGVPWWPLGIIRWWLWWGAVIPRAFLLPALAGGALLLLGSVWLLLPKPYKPVEARWATLWALWRVGCVGKQGVVLGWYGPWLLRYRGEGNIVVIGKSGGGKTAAVQATLCELEESMIIYNPKGTLQRYTYGSTTYDFAVYRRTLGPVVNLQPGVSTDQYNPWDALAGTDETLLLREATLLADILLHPDGAEPVDDAAKFYAGMARQYLPALIMFGVESQLATTGADLLELHVEGKLEHIVCGMEQSAYPTLHRAAATMRKARASDRNGMLQSVTNALSLFGAPDVAEMTSATTLPLEQLRDGERPATVYLTLPFYEQARLRTLYRVILNQHLMHSFRKLQWRHRCLAIIEEQPSLRYAAVLHESVNFNREYGLRFLLITPSMNELIQIYGRYHNFLETAAVQLYFGSNDEEVAHRISRRIGTHTVTVNDETREVPLISPTGILQIDKYAPNVLLACGGHYRVLRQARHYQHRRWTKRSVVR